MDCIVICPIDPRTLGVSYIRDIIDVGLDISVSLNMAHNLSGSQFLRPLSAGSSSSLH